MKPVWIQICLYLPKLAKSEYLRQAIGIEFNEENTFAAAKERAALKQGVDMINQLSGLVDSNQKPVFSMKFLVEKFLNFSDDDMALNSQYKQAEIIEALERAKLIRDHKKAQMAVQNANGGGMNAANGGMNDFGESGGDFGGGEDFGAGDFGGGDDFGSGGGDDFVNPLDDMGGGAEEPAGGSEDFA